jgi:hypothetical protein
MERGDWSLQICHLSLAISEMTNFPFSAVSLLISLASCRDLSAQKKLPEKHTSQGGKGRCYLSGSDWTQ